MIKRLDLSGPASRKFIAGLFILSFALMAVLMYFSPFLSDDFEFSSFDFANLGEALDYCLHYGNGRLLGNLGNIVLLLAPFWRVVVKASVTAGILVLLPVALKLKSRLSYLLSFLLFVGLAPSMFAQVYTWTSGFQNYVPPLLILIFSYMLWAAREDLPLWQAVLKSLAIFVLAVMGQLYMEHGTILSIALGVAALVYSIARNKKKTLLSSLYLAGSLLGGAVMYFIPKLFEINNPLWNLYRRTYLDSFAEMITTVYSNLLQLVSFFAGAIPLCLALGIGVFALLRRTKDSWNNPGLRKAAEVISVAFPLYTVLDRLFFTGTNYVLFPKLHQLIFTVLCLAFLVVLICTALHLKNKQMRAIIVVCAAAAIFSMAPLLIVSPIEERCVFLAYLFLAAIALLILDELAPDLPETVRVTGGRCGAIGGLILSLCLIYTFTNIHWVDSQRIAYIEDQMENAPSEISISLLPSDYVFFDGSRYYGTWYYNEERHDINFTFTDFDSWQARRWAEGWYDQK